MAISFLSYEFLSHPYNLLLQALLAVVFAYFLLKRNGKKNVESNRKLRDVDEFLADWTPEALPTQLTASQQRNLKEYVITESGITHATVNGKDVLHTARSNYLGLSGDERLNKVAEQTMRKYGVGSCGPRGFYGTIDTHIFLEHRIANFLGTEDAILYSSAFATTSSAIPCFSKREDIIICDKGVTHHIQTGIALSRSKVFYFNHNDLKDLERVLKETMPTHPSTKLVRKFLVIEGLYYNYGDVCPLREIMELKEKYKFRLILDESHSIGTLGKTGRGVTELTGVNRLEVELLTGNLGNGFGASGGFCASTKDLVYHQRLQGSGYVFSASLPPFVSACAEASIDLLDSNPEILSSLSSNIIKFHDSWNARAARRTGADKGDLGLEITSSRVSPLVHLRLTPSALRNADSRDAQEDALEAICTHAFNNSNVFISRAKYIDKELFLPPPSIRLCINAAFSEEDILQIVNSLGAAVEATL